MLTTIRATRPKRQGGHVHFGDGVPPYWKDVRRELRRASELIESEVEFNEFLLSSPESDTLGQNIRGLIRQCLRTDHDIVLTHADLHPRNIMVEEQSEPGSERLLNIAGTLDWELSGWYPSYLEYVKALHTGGSSSDAPDWWRYLPTEAA